MRRLFSQCSLSTASFRSRFISFPPTFHSDGLDFSFFFLPPHRGGSRFLHLRTLEFPNERRNASLAKRRKTGNELQVIGSRGNYWFREGILYGVPMRMPQRLDGRKEIPEIPATRVCVLVLAVTHSPFRLSMKSHPRFLAFTHIARSLVTFGARNKRLSWNVSLRL